MGIVEDLSRLDEVHRTGVLTESEFSMAKAHLLGAAPQPEESPTSPECAPAADSSETKVLERIRWPLEAKILIGFLVILVLALLAPLAYDAFERALFRNIRWDSQ